ncbi:hypothetical protein K0A97_01490 [Patescibacteria group bacterium]|nr:hypothetical protein [Patescibacteria group bacterium]
MEKGGQMNISFGMIFSVILVIVFLTVAFYAIRTFLKMQENVSIGIFLEDLQEDVNNLWHAEGSQEREYSLPSKIRYICFVDNTQEPQGRYQSFFEDVSFAAQSTNNLAFYPLRSSDIESVEIKNINLESIISQGNPYCIENVKGEVKLTLIKGISEALVRIE